MLRGHEIHSSLRYSGLNCPDIIYCPPLISQMEDPRCCCWLNNRPASKPTTYRAPFWCGKPATKTCWKHFRRNVCLRCHLEADLTMVKTRNILPTDDWLEEPTWPPLPHDRRYDSRECAVATASHRSKMGPSPFSMACQETSSANK